MGTRNCEYILAESEFARSRKAAEGKSKVPCWDVAGGIVAIRVHESLCSDAHVEYTPKTEASTRAEVVKG